ncbi:hypothetical protein QBC34DRAFT_460785 [Podospora aff. communis PSN243]|uniref:Uncharacterized protein n=1 Tax=Podospora aff. communis PSN243 TaxID=3040156 RepID=A0AAV9GR43_9PEZI|nr:hypothetical protein QBC34DRAFT_460785 [Podospora aff. communis PSN243]
MQGGSKDVHKVAMQREILYHCEATQRLVETTTYIFLSSSSAANTPILTLLCQSLTFIHLNENLQTTQVSQKMLFSKLSLIVATFAIGGNAIMVDLYSDPDCKVAAGSRNVWDNSCAHLGGFQSFKVTYPGGVGQVLRAYNRNACAGRVSRCLNARDGWAGKCYLARTSDGGSNAMGSAGFKCAADEPEW